MRFKVFLARFLGWFFFDFLRFRRWTILKNITIAFPLIDKEQKYKIARTGIFNLCLNFLEFWGMPFLDKKNFQSRVVFEGIENYERAVAQNKGILFLSLHTGNGDLGLAYLSLNNIQMNAISKKFKNKFFNRLWFGVRERLGTRFIDPHGPNTAFDILKACKRNEGVLFVLDQFMSKPYGIETTFFGRKTGTAYGLALFSLKTQAPVVPLYIYRDANYISHIVFEPVVDCSGVEGLEREQQILTLTERYNRILESIVQRYPEFWMWIHRRWKKWE